MTESFEVFLGRWPVNWAVLFVEAPIDAVSDAYEKLLQRPVQRDVGISLSPEFEYPPFNAVVQVEGSDWVIVFHDFNKFAVLPVLSGFRHRVLEFAGGEGGCVQNCSLCVPLARPLHYRTRGDRKDEDDYYEMSGAKPTKRTNEQLVSSYAEVFEQYGIVPVRMTRSADGKVVVMQNSDPHIVRVDAAHSEWLKQESPT